MYKVLVNETDGTQGILDLADNQDYYGDSVWNEKVDGPMPSFNANDMGGLERSGNSLTVNNGKKNQHDAEKAKQASDKLKETSKKSDIKNASDFDELKTALINYFNIK